MRNGRRIARHNRIEQKDLPHNKYNINLNKNYNPYCIMLWFYIVHSMSGLCKGITTLISGGYTQRRFKKMNKMELLESLRKSLKEEKALLASLEELAKIDVSKYDGKKLTKRFITFLESKTTLSKFSLEDSYYNKHLRVYTLDRMNPYHDYMTIYLNIDKENNTNGFIVSKYIEDLKNYITSKTNTVKKIEQNIKSIDKVIKTYNKLVALESDFSDMVAYPIRDSLHWNKSLYYPITTEEAQQ